MNQFANIDTGSAGGEGPWINWTARGTQDAVIPPKSFYLNEEKVKSVIEAFSSTGVVLDIENMKTGWIQSEGVAGQAPKKHWNKSLARFEEQPGEDFKKGFSIRCALSRNKAATWEQSGAAVWNAFVALVPQLAQAPAGKLPLVKLTGTKVQQFKRGTTVEPVLAIERWVDRPDCLKGDGIAIDPTPVAAPAPAPQPAKVAALTDDAPF